MEKHQIVGWIFSQSWPTDEEMVAFALKRHGFGGDDGYYGLNYPGDLDEYDLSQGEGIPEGMVELTYWDGEIRETLIPEKDYLLLLAAHLEGLEKQSPAQKIRDLAAEI